MFKSLLEAIPLPIFVVDRALVIHYINSSGQHLYDISTYAKKPRLDQVIRDGSILQLVHDCVRTGNPQQGLYDRGRTDVAWRVSVTPLAHYKDTLPDDKTQQEQVSSDYTFFAVTMEDRAEIRRLERVQRDFLANVSHELRTPLTSVRLMAETLEDTIDTDPDKAQEFIEKIETEIQYLSGMVAELLELSRIESGQMPMSIEPVEAESLVREVMARMLPLAQRHRVRLFTEIAGGKTLVAADSKLITRVLFNLVHNAIKFTPTGGMIVIGSTLQEDRHEQSFFVRDTGVGIPEEDLSRVFERFYKTDRARSKSNFVGPGGGGTGLGLAIARQVVEAHGGRIMAESAVDKGSTFTFTLPVAIRNEQ